MMNAKLNVGDVVKSLDFVGIQDCYFVGLVLSIDEEMGTFRAKTVKRVWRGRAEALREREKFFFAPLQGQMMLDDPNEPRVIVVA